MEELSHAPPIVESIFKYLPARDLSVCAKVCKLWNSMSTTEFKRRRQVDWFFQECCVGYTHRNFTSNGSELKEQLNNLWIKPVFCIALATYSFLKDFDDIFVGYAADEPDKKKIKSSNSIHKRKYLHSVIESTLQSYLPASSTITFSVAPGIVGCLQNGSSFEVENGHAITGFCIPKLPGVDIHHYPLNGTKWNLLDMCAEEIHIKCILVFLTPRATSIADNLIHSFVSKESSKIAVGGAVVERTESLIGSIIAFSGENVEASSLIISLTDRNEDVKNKLKHFQDTGLLRNRCFAFMFACLARGEEFHGSCNFESSAFHSLYPHVPLIGVFGNGEIGVNFFQHIPTKQTSAVKRVKKYLHSYSTVFVLISIKE